MNIQDIVEDLLIEFGGDSYIDGSEEITEFIINLLYDFTKWLGNNYTLYDEDKWTNSVDYKTSREVLSEYLTERKKIIYKYTDIK
jgi:ribosomal protein S18